MCILNIMFLSYQKSENTLRVLIYFEASIAYHLLLLLAWKPIYHHCKWNIFLIFINCNWFYLSYRYRSLFYYFLWFQIICILAMSKFTRFFVWFQLLLAYSDDWELTSKLLSFRIYFKVGYLNNIFVVKVFYQYK